MVRSNVGNGGVLLQVVEWNRNWLTMGGFVACSTWLEFQFVESMGETSEDSANCNRTSHLAESPWMELEAILNWSSGQGRRAINPRP